MTEVRPAARASLQAVGLGLRESGKATVLRLQNVRRGMAVQRSRPAVRGLHKQQLVLEPGEGQLAVVVDAERILVQAADLVAEALVVILLEGEAALVRRLGADDECPGDVAAESLEQSEGIHHRRSRTCGKRRKRIPFREHTAQKRHRCGRPVSERQRAGDEWRVPRPALERLVGVAKTKTDVATPLAFDVGDVQPVEPYL